MELGKIVGGILLVGATAAVWFWPDAEKEQASPEPVRPIRSAVVVANDRMPDLKFVGTIKATETRVLAFKQSGRIERIPVSKAQKVKKGEKLAWLDAKDFRDKLAVAEAAVSRDRLSYQRKSDAAKKRAISSEEVSQAEAHLKQSEATYELAKRALEETVLVAPFDCIVADVSADELDMTSANVPTLTVQDLSKIKIDVVYPEAMVILARKLKARDGSDYFPVDVSFDSFPGRTFKAQFVEFTAKADRKTQTFLGTYVMTPPADLLLLPGMSATVTIPGDIYSLEDDERRQASIAVPESSIAIDKDGRHYVWKLVETAEKGVFEARRTTIEVGVNERDRVYVLKGLNVGERIATAGVTVLTEGRKVSLQDK